ncbi:tripartite motif-containing protein 10-like [Chrysemys picta bellii]|uniref:tripartite motif-containing protein 10-like n=1 Tax=Chrysemys picta bellii TaxID=8478 RepID=UPI0032B227DC
MEIQEETKCPICLQYLTDPVTIDCGHNFCRVCITQHCETWTEGDHDPLCCPSCKAIIRNRTLQNNYQLANIVKTIKKLDLKPGKENLCERHSKALDLFCDKDGEAVCVVCWRSPEHRSHPVLLMEEAAQKYKVGHTVDPGSFNPFLFRLNLSEPWNLPVSQTFYLDLWLHLNLSPAGSFLWAGAGSPGHWTNSPLDLDGKTSPYTPLSILKMKPPKSFLSLQEKIQAYLKTLSEEREKLLGFKVTGEDKIQEYLKQIEKERQKIVSEFQQLLQFLEEQERLLLAQLEKLDKEIVKIQNENITKLSEEISRLSELISEMEGKYQKPAREFLQKLFLSRCEKGKFQQPLEITPELEKRLSDFSQKTMALMETLRKFKGT